jgi:hypothetical protein
MGHNFGWRAARSRIGAFRRLVIQLPTFFLVTPRLAPEHYSSSTTSTQLFPLFTIEKHCPESNTGKTPITPESGTKGPELTEQTVRALGKRIGVNATAETAG